ncbi:hypothetical protein I547_3256 [Mycobacterium kansasii 824]|nr:hypothetical protein I547_3256 [Mycobacterium kansasii 824]
MLAKLAAPGMCNPESETPGVDGSPSQAAIDTDTRSAAQRSHDGLLAGLRALLASGELGQHNGLPAPIIVSTTLAELEAAAGQGLTGGGTLLPMSDVIRLARHARHYLAVFDGGKTLALYHSKRLAAPGQRIDPPRHPLRPIPQHRRQPTHLRLRRPPPVSRQRLEHPQKHPRRHRMDTPTPPRLVWINGPTPHQHAPPEKLLHADEDDETE